jgi:hypothetical protein
MNLIDKGWTAIAIRHHLGMTKHGLASRVRRMRDAGANIPPMKREPGTKGTPRSQCFSYCATVEHDPKRATLQHLLDLKRAGHSPAQTEFVISAEYAAGPRVYPVYGSCMGSAAAMCSDA